MVEEELGTVSSTHRECTRAPGIYSSSVCGNTRTRVHTFSITRSHNSHTLHIPLAQSHNLTFPYYTHMSLSQPTKNITIVDNRLGSGMGISIGSSVSGGVEDVLYARNVMTETEGQWGMGIHIKTRTSYTGVAVAVAVGVDVAVVRVRSRANMYHVRRTSFSFDTVGVLSVFK